MLAAIVFWNKEVKPPAHLVKSLSWYVLVRCTERKAGGHLTGGSPTKKAGGPAALKAGGIAKTGSHPLLVTGIRVLVKAGSCCGLPIQ